MLFGAIFTLMLDPKHILITGASSGLGAALAKAYAAHGVTLSLQGRDLARLNQTAEFAEKRGARVTIKQIDVTNAEGMKEWLISCEKLQPVDLVIANAGISAGTGDGFEGDAQARAIFDTNLIGVLNTIQPIVPMMMKRHRGQIAIMGSLAGFRGIQGAPAYCASKAAVRVYGEALRSDIMAYGVEVNVVCPGFVKTPMTDVNRFFMPFLMTAERAASIIIRGLAVDRARIAFPLPMYLLVRIISALPQWVADKLFVRLPRKRGQEII